MRKTNKLPPDDYPCLGFIAAIYNENCGECPFACLCTIIAMGDYFKKLQEGGEKDDKETT